MTARRLLFERVFGVHLRASEREERRKEAALAAQYQNTVRHLKG